MTASAIVELVDQLLEYCGELYSDPNAKGSECGADVQFSVLGRTIGVQMTLYHNDEGQMGRRGSRSRLIEKKKGDEAMKAEGAAKGYSHWARADYIPLCLGLKPKLRRRSSIRTDCLMVSCLRTCVDVGRNWVYDHRLRTRAPDCHIELRGIPVRGNS